MPRNQNGIWVYDPVWFCIYCSDGRIVDATNRKLGAEHIIPFGLGGNQILPRSSCKKCGRITGKVEMQCQHMMMGPIRIRLNLPTRHPEDRPTELTMVFNHRDGRIEEKTVPAAEFPLVFPGLKLPPPGVLTGEEPHEHNVGETWLRHTDELMKHVVDGGPALRLATLNNHVFAQMLAKIAHSFAVAEWGFHNFNHYLPDLILGNSKTPFYLVGGNMTVQSPDPNGLHRIFAKREQIGSKIYVIVYLTLFCFVGAPEYRIVVGEWKGGAN
jgi:hypothetical protein